MRKKNEQKTNQINEKIEKSNNYQTKSVKSFSIDLSISSEVNIALIHFKLNEI